MPRGRSVIEEGPCASDCRPGVPKETSGPSSRSRKPEGAGARRTPRLLQRRGARPGLARAGRGHRGAGGRGRYLPPAPRAHRSAGPRELPHRQPRQAARSHLRGHARPDRGRDVRGRPPARRTLAARRRALPGTPGHQRRGRRRDPLCLPRLRSGLPDPPLPATTRPWEPRAWVCCSTRCSGGWQTAPWTPSWPRA